MTISIYPTCQHEYSEEADFIGWLRCEKCGFSTLLIYRQPEWEFDLTQ